MPTPTDPLELLPLAERVAREAAALLIDGLGRQREQVDHKSSPTDLVTEMDRRSEAHIVAAIRSARSADGFLGEEGTSESGTSGVRWVIDPLDGTTNYLYRHPGFAVSIAAQLDGSTILGVVLDPMHGELFAAVRGRGATCNDAAISASSGTRLGHALVATGFAYDAVARRHQAETLVELLPQIRDIRRMGAASVDLCSVACGRVDAYFEAGLAPWDHAAGALIAREAGAIVVAHEPEPDGPAFVIAAGAALFDQLHAIVGPG